MSLLASQMTPKMSTAYSGLSALIQAATSQLSDLAETSISDTNSPEGSPPLLSNPTTPTLEGAHLYLDGSLSKYENGTGIATVTPVATSFQGQRLGTSTELYFPEVLMLLLANPANEDIVTFLPDGKYFALREFDFAQNLLHKSFQLSSFEDFLAEARGWGFIRVNGNISDSYSRTSNANNGDCKESSEQNAETSKDEIYVFRHPYFERNKPIDLSKMRRQMKMKTRLDLGQKGSEERNNTKRQLPLSSDDEFEVNRQRVRTETNTSPVNGNPLLFSGIPSDEPVQLRRRSSLELRGVAQAITTSKLQLNSSIEYVNESDDDNRGSSGPCGANVTVYLGDETDRMRLKQERRSSTTSLVDGGVETATQNIVTDAIEALLFDEGHTRETYSRHEKELSISSLPGVVPISKQLFSANDDNNSAGGGTSNDNSEMESRNKESNSRSRKETTNDNESEQLAPSCWGDQNAVDSLEDASRNNADYLPSRSFTRNGDLKVIIPSDHVGAQYQHRSTDRSTVVSPARMEAAAALVSQSRNRSESC